MQAGEAIVSQKRIEDTTLELGLGVRVFISCLPPVHHTVQFESVMGSGLLWTLNPTPHVQIWPVLILLLH